MKNINTMMPIKTTKTITAMSISFLFLATILAIEAYDNPLSAFAQTTNETPNQQQQQTSQPPSSPAQTTPTTQTQVVPLNLSTFVAGGNIGSENPSTQGNNHILTGGWELAVVNGTLQGFVSGFTMVQVDGNDRNTMTILKVFSGGNSSNVTLQPQGNTVINTSVDITQNGNLKWSNIPAEITIHKASTISIMFQDQSAKDHFGGEPVYGTIATIFDPVGERVVVLQ
jgi:hypothetical protein